MVWKTTACSCSVSSGTSACQILNSIFICEVSRLAPIEQAAALLTIKSDPWFLWGWLILRFPYMGVQSLQHPNTCLSPDLPKQTCHFFTEYFILFFTFRQLLTLKLQAASRNFVVVTWQMNLAGLDYVASDSQKSVISEKAHLILERKNF